MTPYVSISYEQEELGEDHGLGWYVSQMPYEPRLTC
jgi:hypothetical protein